MRVSREKVAENRARILDVAGRLFREKGFEGVGVADIMKAAGLTHGGFYGHFGSKDQLAFEASQALVDKAAEHWTSVVQEAPADPLDALLDDYLCRRNVDAPGKSCIFAALTQDVSRHGPEMQSAFTGGLQALAGILEAIVPGETPQERRRHALASLSAMMGAVILARATDDAALADEFLSAVRETLSEPSSAA